MLNLLMLECHLSWIYTQSFRWSLEQKSYGELCITNLHFWRYVLQNGLFYNQFPIKHVWCELHFCLRGMKTFDFHYPVYDLFKTYNALYWFNTSTRCVLRGLLWNICRSVRLEVYIEERLWVSIAAATVCQQTETGFTCLHGPLSECNVPTTVFLSLTLRYGALATNML